MNPQLARNREHDASAHAGANDIGASTASDNETGAQALVRELEALDVRRVFGYPGGAIMPVYDALLDSGIEHVLVRHEQAAALAACGQARVSNDVGVCIATSGPGATNLITGIADAFADSVPLVAITGQVPTALIGTNAFQEVDIFGMTLPIVKHSFMVRSAEDVRNTLRRAFAIARSGRPGPVLVDLPKDVALACVGRNPSPREGDATSPNASPEPGLLERATRLMRTANRPIVYAGGGIVRGEATAAFRGFVEQLGAPVVTTLNGIGTLPSDHELLLGMLGMHGSRAANVAAQEADLLICLGARFDDRATGRLNAFAPRARVLHVDIDRAELGKLRQAHLAIAANVRDFLTHVTIDRPAIEAWRRSCLHRRDDDAQHVSSHGDSIDAPSFLRELTGRDPGRWIVTCDVGQHQMWVAQHARFTEPCQHLSSGGLGTMGFGLPAAIGAALARPDRDVITISGDGSFLMNVQELATVRRYRIPLKIVVLDNSALGLVRQWQTLFYERRHSEIDLSDNPDFVAVAESFGIPALRCARPADVPGTIDALESTNGPLLVHVPIDARANVWPLVPPDHANDQMLEEPPCGAY